MSLCRAYNSKVTISRLPETVLTLYAELLDQLRGAEAPVSGSFVSKQIRGATYWYFQTVAGGHKRQRYIGRESPEVLDRMKKASETRTAVAADEQRRAELVAMLAAGGMVREPAAVASVLRILDSSGVFRSGGVLIGTHAFTCYANLLGVRFEAQSLRTADIDIGHDPRRVEPAFSVATGIDLREPSTSFRVRGRELRVDFRNAAARPAGLDYLLADTVPAAIVGGSGVLVNVPQPARFALHKLWIAQQRPASEQAKARKDLRQAEQLIEVLTDDRSDDLRVAIVALQRRPSMMRSIRAALRKMNLLASFDGLMIRK